MNKCSCCVVTTNNPERFTILEKNIDSINSLKTIL